MKWTLKGIRANLDLEQEEMAEKLGVSRRQWQKFEQYEAFPNIKIVKKIIELSNVDFNDIVFLPDDYAKSENDKEK